MIAFLLPIRLSSTTKTMSIPWARIASSSAITWAEVLMRGRRPKVTMMSQNSHWNGQPRENWSEPKALSQSTEPVLTMMYQPRMTVSISNAHEVRRSDAN